MVVQELFNEIEKFNIIGDLCSSDFMDQNIAVAGNRGEIEILDIKTLDKQKIIVTEKTFRAQQIVRLIQESGVLVGDGFGEVNIFPNYRDTDRRINFESDYTGRITDIRVLSDYRLAWSTQYALSVMEREPDTGDYERINKIEIPNPINRIIKSDRQDSITLVSTPVDDASIQNKLIRWDYISGDIITSQKQFFGISEVLDMGSVILVAEENGILNVLDGDTFNEIEVNQRFNTALHGDNFFPSRSRVISTNYSDGLLTTAALKGDIIMWDFNPDSLDSAKERFRFNFGSAPRYIFSEKNTKYVLTTNDEVFAIDNETGDHELRTKLSISPRFANYSDGNLIGISNEGGVRRYNLSEGD